MPASRVFEFVDPHPYQTAIRAAEVEVFVASKGAFRAELTQVELHRLWMQFGRENLSRVFHSSVSKKRAPIVFLTDADQAPMHHSGIEVPPGAIIVDGLGSTHHIRSWGECRWGAMSLTPEDLAEVGLALLGRELTVPSDTRLLCPSPPHMAQLLSLHQGARQLAKTAPQLLAHPQVAKALEQALLRAMVLCLGDGASAEMGDRGRNHTKIIAKLQEFLVTNFDRPVHLSELCAATGASERVLHKSCQEHLGMGPIRYLWLRRMYLAHHALIQAIPETTTVTAIATKFGFWELGRFSITYRTLFGESPSTSLHRRSGC